MAVGEPAVHDDGFVASMDLDFGHFKDDISHILILEQLPSGVQLVMWN